jgi:hypothetical protein
MSLDRKTIVIAPLSALLGTCVLFGEARAGEPSALEDYVQCLEQFQPEPNEALTEETVDAAVSACDEYKLTFIEQFEDGDRDEVAARLSAMESSYRVQAQEDQGGTE